MMETPKQQAIKAAYGEHWERVKDYVDEDGWCNAFFGIAARDFDDTESKREVWRPKSLSGIETNQGWTRIESEEDMPKPKGVEDVLVITETGEITVENSMSLNDIEVRRYWLRTISHWQPFIKPNLPLY
ncbi:hypothetical protein CMT42_15465 [Elizabethkingia anophelis]|uniref:DUF551 domain-containing protein n=1 Tax=Elizabethkingia anophelis TaxID=1117645 RepID=A0A494J2D4_9FLAO|nr:hypothetical protein [Elizabethkingia anophelis]AQX52523.1 hypothetical protein AYC66_18375 [Elizabethkingia anophelis]MDV3917883.1 hypothetical protein [Elizabethkingia anophelis]MDV3920594.1 hypothetical protein [Elizabethkingia anophelis]MDV3934957.1 hypothetical protein [Elizabethkingia anophelis]MDV3992903.1 hypothetical protein [Elizabethkingia anophelis]